MQDRSQRIAIEVTKVAAILLVCFLWFDARLEENSGQVAHATSVNLEQAKVETEARLAQIEQDHELTRMRLEAANGQVREFEEGLLSQQEDFLNNERVMLLNLLEKRSSELRTLIEQGLNRIDGAAVAATEEVNSRVENLASTIQRQPLDMKKRMIYPVVQLRGNGTVGSGVVVRSEPVGKNGKSATYILTAHHVVYEVMTPGTERRDIVEDLRFLDPSTDRLGMISHQAKVIAEQSDHDLALLLVYLDEPWPYVAQLANRTEVENLEIFEPVYAVGCPLGNKPLPSVGEISSQEKRVSGSTFWMVNAPTFFGNSGGGIFHHSSGRLVGISSMIYTYGKRQPMVVPHMGLFVPLETVRSWLEGEGHGHFFADAGKDSGNGDPSKATVAESAYPISD